MNHQEVLCNFILAAVAECGNLGGTISDIKDSVPLDAIHKAQGEAGIDSSYLSEKVVSIFIARLLQEGKLKVHAPGGINRYVLVTPDPDGELTALKERVYRLEEQVVALRNYNFLR